MEKRIKIYNRTAAIVLFIGLPILLWSLNNVPQRTLLKMAISVLTLVAFSISLMQFYLARSNRKLLKEHTFKKVIKWHRVIGYCLVSILFFHPFLIVVPRYFEAGVQPGEAFITLLTTFNNLGVVLGIIAWCLMVLIGLTAVFRKQLPISYKTWRIVHGLLSIIFIVLATWHAIYLGRDTNISMSLLFITMAAGGIFLLVRTYFNKENSKS